MNRLMTYKETAKILGMSEGALRVCKNRKQIIAKKIGTRVRFEYEEVRRFIDEGPRGKEDGK